MPCRPTTGGDVESGAWEEGIAAIHCPLTERLALLIRTPHQSGVSASRSSNDHIVILMAMKDQVDWVPRGLVDDPLLTIDQEWTTGMGRPSRVKSVTDGPVSYQHQSIQPVKGHCINISSSSNSNLSQMWPRFALASQQTRVGRSPGPRKDISCGNQVEKEKLR